MSKFGLINSAQTQQPQPQSQRQPKHQHQHQHQQQSLLLSEEQISKVVSRLLKSQNVHGFIDLAQSGTSSVQTQQPQPPNQHQPQPQRPN